MPDDPAPFDVEGIRRQFPILGTEVHGHPLVYLDNAATTQVPTCVTERIAAHYATSNANVHRGMHWLAHLSTDGLEDARRTVSSFINAPDADGVVFTRGATDSLNMAAQGLKHLLGPQDRVVTSIMEHHSNLLPWQQACKEKGAELCIVGTDANGDLDMGEYARALDGERRVPVVSLTGCSNVIGSCTLLQKAARLAHEAGALVVVDGAQMMRHGMVDIQDIGCDFFAFSGHKMMAGTGTGVLAGPIRSMGLLRPRDFGGEMVKEARRDGAEWEDLPLRLEAGTPNYVGAFALAEACRFLEREGRGDIAQHEDVLLSRAEEGLRSIPGIAIIGRPRRRSGLVSFTVEGVHPFDLCSLADAQGVALRAGHNCAQPLLAHLGLDSVARLSPAFYNTPGEIDAAVDVIERSVHLLRTAGRKETS